MKIIKIIFIILIIVTIITSGCIRKSVMTNESTPVGSEPGVFPGSKITPPEKSFLYEGPIYETHPYYYDGTFKGLIEKIPSIAELGIKTIYLMPIWEKQKNSPEFIYIIKDYYKIDPTYGTSEELKELVNVAHEYDMKILFDLVTCCTFENSILWNNDWVLSVPLSEIDKSGLKLEYIIKDNTKYVYSNCDFGSKAYCEFSGKPIDNKVMLLYSPYAGWGFAVDRINPEVIDYFTNVAVYYIKEYNIDGWRVDSPVDNYNKDILKEDHSSLKLLRNVKKAITNIKPDAILIAESPSAIRPNGSMPDPVFDEVAEAAYSYPFQRQLKDLKTSEQFNGFFSNEKKFYNRTRLRLLETHDSQRINKIAPQLNKPLLVLISTIPGIQMIQAGQEIGATNDWFNSNSNPKVDWANGNYELRNFYKKVFGIRKTNNALKYGTISNVWRSGDNIYAYLRSYDDDKTVVILNPMNKEGTSTLDLSFLNKGDTLFDELNDEKFVVDNPDNFKITVPAYGSRILVKQG